MTLDPLKKTFARTLRKNQTDAEKVLWLQLRNRQLFKAKFRRQQSLGKYIVDFFSYEQKLVIEIDGGQHNSEENISYDNERTIWLEKYGYTVLRFWNNEIMENLEGVLTKIHLTLTLSSRRGKRRHRERSL